MKYLIIKWGDDETTLATIYKTNGIKYMPYLFFTKDLLRWSFCPQPRQWWTLKQLVDFSLIEDWGTLEDEHVFSILL